MADDLHDSFTDDHSGTELGAGTEEYVEDESFDDDDEDDESFDDDDEDATDDADGEADGAPRELDDDAGVEEDDLDLLLDEELVPLDEDDDGPRSGRKAEPMGAGEFTCRNCFLVRRRSQLADETRMLCVDCA